MSISFQHIPLSHKALQYILWWWLSLINDLLIPLGIFPPCNSKSFKLGYGITTLLDIGKIINLKDSLTRRFPCEISLGTTFSSESWKVSLDRVDSYILTSIATFVIIIVPLILTLGRFPKFPVLCGTRPNLPTRPLCSAWPVGLFLMYSANSRFIVFFKLILRFLFSYPLDLDGFVLVTWYLE